MNNDVLVIMMFQCRYISGSRHSTLRKDVKDGGSFTQVGAEAIYKILFNIATNPKLLKNKVYLGNPTFNFVANKNSFYVIQMYDSK